MTIATISYLLAQKDSGGGSIFGLLVLLLPMGAILYLSVMPQRKQRQKQADMLRKLEVGDEVLTNGGIVGVITHVEDDLFHVEIDDDVVVRMAKSAVSRNLSEPEETTPTKSRKGLLEGALGGSKEPDSKADKNADSKGSR